MTSKNILPRTKIADFIDNLYDGDLHAKRVLSLANATLGVLVSASLAVHAIGQGLAQALGKLSKHGVKQVDRLLSNQGIDVWEFFGYWIPYLVGARTEVVVAMDWTSFARDQQDTIVLSMLTGGVGPRLIIANEDLHGEGAPHCQGTTLVFDTIARAETTRDRIGGFGRASAASEWLARRTAPIACRSA